MPPVPQQLLQQLGELLFRKEPALVPQFSAALLELQARASALRSCSAAPGFLTRAQAEPTGAVRKFLASVLDALAGSSVHLVAPCASAAISLMRVRGQVSLLFDAQRVLTPTFRASVGFASRGCEGGVAVWHGRASAYCRACLQAGVCSALHIRGQRLRRRTSNRAAASRSQRWLRRGQLRGRCLLKRAALQWALTTAESSCRPSSLSRLLRSRTLRP